MFDLTGAVMHRYAAARTDADAGPTTATGLAIEMRKKWAADPGEETDGGGGTDIPTGLTIDEIHRETVIADDRMMIKLPGIVRRENPLGTSIRAQSAERAFAEIEVYRRNARLKDDYFLGAGIQTVPAPGAILDCRVRCAER